MLLRLRAAVVAAHIAMVILVALVVAVRLMEGLVAVKVALAAKVTTAAMQMERHLRAAAAAARQSRACRRQPAVWCLVAPVETVFRATLSARKCIMQAAAAAQV